MGLPLICADVGNSAIKLGCVADLPRPASSLSPADPRSLPELAWVVEYRHGSAELSSLTPFRSAAPERQQWLVASVQRHAEQTLARFVHASRPQDDYRLLGATDFPLHIDVEFPDRVGTDRLAAAWGANRLRSPDSHAIVIDAGSAITVDLVDRHGTFRGGVILPGTAMVARALAEQTDLLPRVELAPGGAPPPVVGRSTEAAIRSGLYWGSIGAAREIVERLVPTLDGTVELFLSGGDARNFHAHLGRGAVHVPNLVLRGIASLYQSDPDRTG